MLLSAARTETPALTEGPVIGTFFDPASGRFVVIATPAEQPKLWAAYLKGALASYRRFGVESALDYDRVRDGRTTSFFAVAMERDGRVVAGLRGQGPYTCVDQAYALQEWKGSVGAAALHGEIRDRLADGIVEIKAVWVDHRATRSRALSAALARIFVHSLSLLNVRYAMCSAAIHARPRWQANGGVVSDSVPPVAYPDDRYQTVLMWWDRETVFDLIPSKQILTAIMKESAQLSEQIALATADLSSVA